MHICIPEILIRHQSACSRPSLTGRMDTWQAGTCWGHMGWRRPVNGSTGVRGGIGVDYVINAENWMVLHTPSCSIQQTCKVWIQENQKNLKVLWCMTAVWIHGHIENLFDLMCIVYSTKCHSIYRVFVVICCVIWVRSVMKKFYRPHDQPWPHLWPDDPCIGLSQPLWPHQIPVCHVSSLPVRVVQQHADWCLVDISGIHICLSE